MSTFDHRIIKGLGGSISARLKDVAQDEKALYLVRAAMEAGLSTLQIEEALKHWREELS